MHRIWKLVVNLIGEMVQLSRSFRDDFECAIFDKITRNLFDNLTFLIYDNLEGDFCKFN